MLNSEELISDLLDQLLRENIRYMQLQEKSIILFNSLKYNYDIKTLMDYEVTQVEMQSISNNVAYNLGTKMTQNG